MIYAIALSFKRFPANSLRYMEALFWNSIGDNLKRAPSLNIFKKLLKKKRPLFDIIICKTEMK